MINRHLILPAKNHQPEVGHTYPMSDVVDLLARAAGGVGPGWGAETEDLNCTLLRWKAGHQIAPHVNQEVDVIMVVLEGSGVVSVDGVERQISRGWVAVIPKGAERSVTCSTEMVYLNIHKRRPKLQVGIRRGDR